MYQILMNQMKFSITKLRVSIISTLEIPTYFYKNLTYSLFNKIVKNRRSSTIRSILKGK